MTHAGLRYHFEAKEELLVAVLQKYTQEADHLLSQNLLDSKSEAGAPWEATASFLESVQFSLDNPGFIRLFSSQSLLSSDPGNITYEFFTERLETLRRTYTRFLEVLQEHKILGPDVQPAQTATLLLAVLDGLYMQHLMRPDNDAVITYLRVFLESVCVPEFHGKLADAFDVRSAVAAM